MPRCLAGVLGTVVMGLHSPGSGRRFQEGHPTGVGPGRKVQRALRLFRGCYNLCDGLWAGGPVGLRVPGCWQSLGARGACRLLGESGWMAGMARASRCVREAEHVLGGGASGKRAAQDGGPAASTFLVSPWLAQGDAKNGDKPQTSTALPPQLAGPYPDCLSLTCPDGTSFLLTLLCQGPTTWPGHPAELQVSF